MYGTTYTCAVWISPEWIGLDCAFTNRLSADKHLRNLHISLLDGEGHSVILRLIQEYHHCFSVALIQCAIY